MAEIQIFEVVPAVSGDAIIITAKAFRFDDTCTIWVPREKPLCWHCGCAMEWFEFDSTKLFPEKWRCPSCRRRESFLPGDYGEREIEITIEEWRARAMVRSQRDLLKQRYGKSIPESIRDYWFKPKKEAVNG